MATVKELKGSGNYDGSPASSSAERRYWVTPYSDVPAWTLSQYERVDPDTGRRSGGRRYSSISTMFCSGGSFEGIGRISVGGDGNIDYDGGAIVTLKFTTRPDYDNENGEGDPEDPQNIAYMSESVSISAQVMTVSKSDGAAIPKPAWKWSGGADITLDDPVQLVQIIGTAQWNLTRKFVPSIPRAKIFDAIGKVNNAAYAGLDTGTLLYMGCEANRTISTDGTRSWDLGHKFEYRKIPWNKFPRSSDNTWQTVVAVTGGAPIYSSFDLKALLQANS
jgi:hypothetical protein